MKRSRVLRFTLWATVVVLALVLASTRSRPRPSKAVEAHSAPNATSPRKAPHLDLEAPPPTERRPVTPDPLDETSSSTPAEGAVHLLALSPELGFGQPASSFAEPLRVRTRPGAPVRFSAPDWGVFPNGLRTITKIADADGVASTSFTFGPSASNYRVVAATPSSPDVVVFDLEALDQDAWQAHVRLAELPASTGDSR
jgi:hypothetical protein